MYHKPNIYDDARIIPFSGHASNHKTSTRDEIYSVVVSEDETSPSASDEECAISTAPTSWTSRESFQKQPTDSPPGREHATIAHGRHIKSPLPHYTTINHGAEVSPSTTQTASLATTTPATSTNATDVELSDFAILSARPPGVIVIKTYNEEGEVSVEEVYISREQSMSYTEPNRGVVTRLAERWQNMDRYGASCLSSVVCSCGGVLDKLGRLLPCCAGYERVDGG